jgi:1-phosphofructokinase family hexose kinase
VVTTGFLGGGVGGEIENLLTAENLTHDFVKVSSPSRISVTVSNLKTHLQSRLSFSGPTINHSEWERLTHHLDKLPPEGLAIIGGSLPPGVDGKLFTSFIANLSERGFNCIVDVPGKYLKEACEANPLLIKPNLFEFQELTGKKITSKEDVVLEAQKLLSKVKIICISSVENGALLVTQGGAWFGRIPALEIRTTVGAGDSMVGAMAAKLFEWKNMEGEKSYVAIGQDRGHELHQWGLAASCATLIVRGTELGSAEDIKKYFPEVIVEELKN